MGPGLARDPVATLTRIAAEADGRLVRIDLGWFRPYLLTHPDHVQRVLRDNVTNYPRDGHGMFWRPLRPLLGDGILGDGPEWEASRRNLMPLFTAKRVATLTRTMAETIADGVAALDGYASRGEPVDATEELSRIVARTVIRAFFGGQISDREALALQHALDTIATSVGVRLVLPFLSPAVPLPGDRAVRRAVRTVDGIVLPLVARVARNPVGDDIIATLCRSRGADGQPLTERQVRNDVVAMFGASTETTAVVLSWLWPLLDRHPEVAERLAAECLGVVGGDRIEPAHVPALRYTRMVLDELLRVYPPGWLFPRTATEPDRLGGTDLAAGATVLVSPLIMHRSPAWWDRPDEFDPERFAPDRQQRTHRYAYFPFGGGPHQCIGKHVFQVEAILLVAAVLSRFTVSTMDSDPAMPPARVAASLRPKRRVVLRLGRRDHRHRARPSRPLAA